MDSNKAQIYVTAALYLGYSSFNHFKSFSVIYNIIAFILSILVLAMAINQFNKDK